MIKIDSTISLVELKQGVILCSQHANRLLEKAQAEYEKKDYPLAYVLAFTAYEEYAKALQMSRKRNSLKEKEWEYLCNHIPKQRIADELDKQEATREWKKKYPEDKRIKVIFKDQPEIYNEELKLRNDSLYLGYDFINKKWLVPSDIKDIDVKAGFKIGDALRLRSLLEKRINRKN